MKAGRADLGGVNTGWVPGRSADDGWISFRQEGLNIHQERGMERGTPFASDADLKG
ncbi:hypothetical protein [Nonomuraea sp. NPDC052265]|uniref:hypothetical protein n=1 Tax=Nonomuraea sp. NPDC052265 TaxID=3364374 RepID=UPI0037C5B706